MVVQFAEVLDMPLHARNELLEAAGFAAAYPRRSLDDPTMAHIRRVLDTMLAAHEPFPAYLVDHRWDLVATNESVGHVTGLVPDPAGARAAGAGNVLRLLFHPEGLRPHVVNWQQVGAALLHRLRRDRAHRPDDDELAALLEELRNLAPVDLRAIEPARPRAEELLVPLHLRVDDWELRLFTTIATVGAPYDVTLEGLRLETLLPADPATGRALRQLAGQAGGDRDGRR